MGILGIGSSNHGQPQQNYSGMGQTPHLSGPGATVGGLYGVTTPGAVPIEGAGGMYSGVPMHDPYGMQPQKKPGAGEMAAAFGKGVIKAPGKVIKELVKPKNLAIGAVLVGAGLAFPPLGVAMLAGGAVLGGALALKGGSQVAKGVNNGDLQQIENGATTGTIGLATAALAGKGAQASAGAQLNAGKNIELASVGLRGKELAAAKTFTEGSKIGILDSVRWAGQSTIGTTKGSLAASGGGIGLDKVLTAQAGKNGLQAGHTYRLPTLIEQNGTLTGNIAGTVKNVANLATGKQNLLTQSGNTAKNATLPGLLKTNATSAIKGHGSLNGGGGAGAAGSKVADQVSTQFANAQQAGLGQTANNAFRQASGFNAQNPAVLPGAGAVVIGSQGNTNNSQGQIDELQGQGQFEFSPEQAGQPPAGF